MNWKKQQAVFAVKIYRTLIITNPCGSDLEAEAVRRANKLMIALQVDNAKERQAA